MNTRDLSEMTGIPVGTLHQYAYLKKGPAFIKLGGHRRYLPDDVNAWIESNRHPPERCDRCLAAFSPGR